MDIQDEDSLQIHSIRLYRPIPQPVVAIAFNEGSSLLAVSRHDCSIEIFSVLDNYFHIGTIPSTESRLELSAPPATGALSVSFDEERILNSLRWVRGRLIAASRGPIGAVFEFNALRTRKVRSVLTSGGGIWCIAGNRLESHLIVGTEDGCLLAYALFDESHQPILEADARYLFPRQTERIVSVAWFETRAPTDHTYVRGPAPPLGGLLAAGSPGAVRLWDMASCAVLSHMDLRGETLGATGPVVPWALCFTRDGTLVSGDSLGRTTFWDTRTATSIRCFESHRADVLSVVASSDADVVYSAGVDPHIVRFECVQRSQAAGEGGGGGGPNSSWPASAALGSAASNAMDVDGAGVGVGACDSVWLRGELLRHHTHDVKSLVLLPDRLVSGGLDCMLIVWQSDAPASRTRKRSKRDLVDRVINPLPLITSVSVATRGHRALFQYPSRVELWSLANTSSAASEQRELRTDEQSAVAMAGSSSSAQMELPGDGDGDCDGEKPDGEAEAEGGAGAVCAALPLASGPQRLVTIEAPAGSVFVASAISACGRLLAIAHSRAALRLFQVRSRGGPRELVAVRECGIGSPAVGCLLFSSDSRTLLLCSRDGALHSLRLHCRAVATETVAASSASLAASSKHELVLAKYRHTRRRGAPALTAALSNNSKLLAVSRSDRSIFIHAVPSLAKLLQLSAHSSLACSLLFSPDASRLLVLYADARVAEFEMPRVPCSAASPVASVECSLSASSTASMEQTTDAFTAFGQRLFALTRARFGEADSSSSSSLQRATKTNGAGVGAAVSRKLRALLAPAASLRHSLLAAGGTASDGEHDERYLLYDTHSLLLLDRSEIDFSRAPNSKQLRFRLCRLYRYVLHVAPLSARELVLIEYPPQLWLASLPPPDKRLALHHKFGR